MKYDFDEIIDRKCTDSIKWNVADGELPMWVADMDFKTAPSVRKAIEDRAAHARRFERAHALNGRAARRADAILERTGVLARFEHHLRRAEHHLRGILDGRRARQSAGNAAVSQRL